MANPNIGNTMTNEWGHLPNAHYIDQIFSSLMSKPKLWNEIYMADEELWEFELGHRWQAAWSTAENILSTSDRWKVWMASYGESKSLRYSQAISTDLGRGAILALIAYDDAAQYLEWDAEKLETVSILTESPTQFLMLPTVKVFNQELVQG